MADQHEPHNEPHIEAEAPTEAEASDYEAARRSANRAQWALNFLVTLSAVAGSVFFFYVLYTIRPWASSVKEPVNVETSNAPASWQVIAGGEATGVWAELRDLDEAAEYRKQLSEQWRRDLGIAADGMLYRLFITNHSETATMELASCELRTSGGATFSIQWLEAVTRPGNANPTGQFRLKQSESKFTLGKGETRQLAVFVPATDAGNPPAATELIGGSLRFRDGSTIELLPEKVKAQTK